MTLRHQTGSLDQTLYVRFSNLGAAMSMEQIIHRARAVLIYIPDPLAAMVYLHNEGCSPAEAFLAVKAAMILGN